MHSGSPPCIRIVTYNHLGSQGTWTCWHSRNRCISAFSLYTVLHVLTPSIPSLKCRLRPLQWSYHLSGIFSLWQPIDNTLYTFRFIISSVLASEEKTNYLNWDLKFSPILFSWTLTIHLQLLLHIMAGFQLNVFILAICEAYLKSWQHFKCWRSSKPSTLKPDTMLYL